MLILGKNSRSERIYLKITYFLGRRKVSTFKYIILQIVRDLKRLILGPQTKMSEEY